MKAKSLERLKELRGLAEANEHIQPVLVTELVDEVIELRRWVRFLRKELGAKYTVIK